MLPEHTTDAQAAGLIVRMSLQFLPLLSTGGSCWRLPLTSQSASVIAGVLLKPDDAEQHFALQQALLVDPALALWAIGRAGVLGFETRTIANAAAWLCANSAALCWPADEPPQGDIQSLRVQCADLVAASIQTAELAAMLTGTANAAESAAYLAGLLHNAQQWLALTTTQSRAAAENCLPGWLQSDLAESSAGPAAHATLARSILAGDAPLPPGVKFNRRASDRRAALLRSAWLAEAGHAATWLPQLCDRLGRLAQLENRFQELLETEKLEALAEFAAGAGHEMNNPLAVIAGRAQLFLRDEEDPERKRELAVMNSQAMRVHEMIADMMLFARPPLPESDWLDLAGLLSELAAELRPKVTPRQIEVSYRQTTAPVMIRADRAQLIVALRAMCDNSCYAMSRGGRLELSLSRTSGDNGSAADGFVEIMVRDTGPGIPADIRRHLFDPFFSGRPAGRGLGLGLSKCWRIVTNHGGTIVVESVPQQETTFTICLPVAGRREQDTETLGESCAG